MIDWRRIRRAAVTVAIRRPGGSDARRHDGRNSASRGVLVSVRGPQRRAVWVLFALVFLTGSAAALLANGGHAERGTLELRRDAANVELDRQLQRVHALRREVQRLHGDSLARERLAREELGYTKRGEMVFLLAEPSKTAGNGAP
jgi:cell division protein FtsB